MAVSSLSLCFMVIMASECMRIPSSRSLRACAMGRTGAEDEEGLDLTMALAGCELRKMK